MWRCELCEASAAGTAVERSKRRRDICSWCDGELDRQGMEWCRRGKHKVARADIAPHKAAVWCRDCKNATRRTAYAASPTAKLARKNAWYRARGGRTSEQRERQREINRAYAARNRDRLRERQRRDYWTRERERRIERARARRQQWQATDPAGYAAVRQEYRARRLLKILRRAA